MNELYVKIADLKNDPKKKYKSVIFFVLAQGDNDNTSHKEGSISIDTLMRLFDERSFKEYKDKPKIFLFQSCRLHP